MWFQKEILKYLRFKKNTVYQRQKREKVTGKEYRRKFRVLEGHEDTERQGKVKLLIIIA